jgi:hypothetical protein
VHLSGLKQLLVFDIPDFLVCPSGNIRNQLTETPIGIPLAQLRNGRK